MKIDASTIAGFPYKPGVTMAPIIAGRLGTGFGLYRGRLEPYACIPQEAHAETETVYVLCGKMNAFVGEQAFSLTSGQVLHVPSGIPHELINAGDSELEILVVGCPDFQQP